MFIINFLKIRNAVILFCCISVIFCNSLFAKTDNVYEQLKMFSTVLDTIQKEYVDNVDSEELVKNAVSGMVNSLDPHSDLLTPDAFKELEIDTSGKFTGIGVELTQRDNSVVVISPIADTPAYKAGIKAGDRIIEVNGEFVKNLQEVIKKTRGRKGESVSITIIREGETEPLIFKLLRDIIPLISVKAALIKPDYGYLWITNFRDKTFTELKEALIKIEKGTNLKGLILDLRDNPGGLLPQAVKTADIFLEKGIIVSIKGRAKNRIKHYRAKPDKIKRDYPMVVLINGGSASASEIVAGALQDNKRALIAGTSSFGKGSVQTIIPLENRYALKLTIARYYTPDGRSIQAKGIIPDVVVRKKTANEKNYKSEIRFKEKDLKNHLTEESSGKPKNKKYFNRNRYGELNIEELESDNQINEALNILTGYNILFSGH